MENFLEHREDYNLEIRGTQQLFRRKLEQTVHNR
jgi:hypothetical protein